MKKEVLLALGLLGALGIGAYYLTRGGLSPSVVESPLQTTPQPTVIITPVPETTTGYTYNVTLPTLETPSLGVLSQTSTSTKASTPSAPSGGTGASSPFVKPPPPEAYTPPKVRAPYTRPKPTPAEKKATQEYLKSPKDPLGILPF